MDWKDTRHGNTVHFIDLKIGDVFAWESLILIKITVGDAFDICNNGILSFSQEDKVEKRKATLVLD